MLKEYLFICLAFIAVRDCSCQCGKEDYKRCVIMANPLLLDSKLIYPDNLRDIDRVCRTWNQFVTCVEKYTDLCFTRDKKREFSEAIRHTSDFVRQLCSSSDYQKEYLKHAPCMRATLIDDSHCGSHYRQFVSQVSDEPATPVLCCSHLRFQQCFLNQTFQSCDKEAYPFARQILDKALGFLQNQCSSYASEMINCPKDEFYSGNGGPWINFKADRIDNWGDDQRRMSASRNHLPPFDNMGDNTRTQSRGHNWNSPTERIWKAAGTPDGVAILDESNQQGLSNTEENSALTTHHRENSLPILLISFLVPLCKKY